MSTQDMKKNIEAIYPLTPTQLGMLFHAIYDGSGEAYYNQFHCLLMGKLDVTAFISSWQFVVARHSVLRTLFAWQNVKSPLQVVLRTFEMPFQRLNWSQLDEASRTARWEKLLEDDRKLGFNLDKKPPVRAALVDCGSGCYRFVWGFHHLLLDGWSLPIVLTEVFTCYEAFKHGKNPVLPKSPPFGQYIQWLSSQDMGTAERYWRETLAGFTESTSLKPKTVATGKTMGSRHEKCLYLSSEVTEGVTQLARKRRVTLGTICQGVWALLLSRYTCSDEVLMGVTVSGRPAGLKGVSSMVGMCINTLPVRVNTSDHQLVSSWLSQLQSQQVRREQYAYAPLTKIGEWSEIPTGQDLFESILIIASRSSEISLPDHVGIKVTEVGGFEETNYPLTMVFGPGEQLKLRLSYEADTYDAHLIDGLLKHLAHLFEVMIDTENTRLGDLSLMSNEEKQRVLHEWNQTDRAFPDKTHLHGLLAAQVTRTPDAVALTFTGGERPVNLTYREIYSKINAVARRLAEFGVGPDSRVGLCCKRSPEMVFGIFGILQAGGAYVPLNPDDPAERINYILDETQASLVLTYDAGNAISEKSGRNCLALDDVHNFPDDKPGTTALTEVLPDHLAYIMFTSGSTGKPKGVAVPHGAIGNRILWAREAFPFGSDVAFLQTAVFTFDISIWELMAPLIVGGRLVLPDQDAHKHPDRLIELVATHEINAIHFVPTLMKALLDQEDVARLSCLKWVFCGGEAMPAELCADFLSRFNVAFHHFYGPTEASINVTSWDAANLQSRKSVSIGTPIANTKIFLLNKLEPVPARVTGELMIGGDSLVRGYLNRPALTAERFVPDPFGNGTRLYRTGDLATYAHDGTLNFQGRADQQVKIRGHRIEPGEIEACLRAEGRVKDAVVIARETPSDNMVLVAYVVPGAQVEAKSFIAALTSYLQERLPSHMVPARLVLLEAIPLTSTGKVDRRALPDPSNTRMGLSSEYQAPSNEKESLLAEIWAEVFGLEKVGVTDNFFELGGDSILSIQVIAKAARVGLKLNPKQLFDCQTIALLAEKARKSTVSGSQGPVLGSMPLTPIQQHFFNRKLIKPSHFNMALMFRLPNSVSKEHMEAALTALINHHDALRLKFTYEGAAMTATHGAPIETVSLLLHDLSDAANPEAALEAATTDMQQSIDLQAGQLLKAGYFRLRQDARLLIVVHHLAMDGVSWRILLEDLQAAFEQAQAGKDLELPGKTTSFKQWAGLLKDYAKTPDVLASLEYWRQLGKQVDPEPLPTDFDAPAQANTEASAAKATVVLSQDQTRRLLGQACKPYSLRVDDIMLAALLQTLNQWRGKQSLFLNLERHGREQINDELDTTRTIGWFTAQFPMVLKAESHEPRSLLCAVKECLRGIPLNGLSYGLLSLVDGEEGARVRAGLRPLHGAPLAFNYLGQIDGNLSDQGPLAPAPESPGAMLDGRERREHLLEVNAVVAESKLRLEWTYSTAFHRAETIKGLAEGMLSCLSALIDHCLKPGVGAYTPSDFPLSGLDQEGLDRLTKGFHDVTAVYPLSPMQTGILFHNLYDNTFDPYFEQVTCVFRGNFNVQAFKEAWDHMSARYSLLRTSFHWDNLDEHLQMVHASAPMSWQDEDWRDRPSEVHQHEIESLLARDRKRGFNLNHPPIQRGTLLRLDQDRWFFLWSHHHLLIDGWSRAKLFDELFLAYEAIDRGRPVQLPAVRPYRDYIAWIMAQDKDAAAKFWHETLAGFHAPNLPTTRKLDPLPQSTEVYHKHQLVLAKDISDRLRQVLKQQRLTLGVVLQGAWSLVMSAYSGERDIVIGNVVSGRPTELEGVETMMGLFINSLPVRVAIAREKRLLPWLNQLQREQLAREKFSFSPLVSILGWSDIPSGNRLFESIIIIDNYPAEKALAKAYDDLSLEELNSYEHTNFPLTVSVQPDDEIKMSITYDDTFFDRSTTARMLNHFHNVVEGMALNPKCRLGEIKLLSQLEEQMHVRIWNDTSVADPSLPCLHQTFENHVEHYPDVAAVRFVGDSTLGLEPEALTYRQLNQRANHIAKCLRDYGVGRESMVGVCLPRCADLVASMLAVWKVGACYVPLDPTTPYDRLAFTMQDSSMTTMVTCEAAIDALPSFELSFLNVIVLDEESLVGEAANPNLAVSPDQALYAIFTSGSTGKPKGVVVSHKAAASLSREQRHQYGVNPGERQLQFYTCSFDGSIWEMLMALGSAGTLVMAPKERLLPGSGLEDILRDYNIDHAALPPTVLHNLDHENLAGLRTLTSAAEPLTPDLVAGLAGKVKLYNSYGPTEFAVAATSALCDGPDWQPSIGRPIQGTQCFVLNDELQLVPRGVKGMLFISGDSMARGYLKRPAMTAERFIPNPFAGAHPDVTAGARLYNTGDQVRYFEDGTLEFIGRVDDQVKVRGYRIELGEVESALTQHPKVKESVVKVFEEKPGDRRLVAYVVGNGEDKPRQDELRQFIKQKLPAYMAPAIFEILEKLPLKSNGKVDREALPEPSPDARSGASKAEPPRNPVEAKLVQVWSDVLGVEHVSIHDGFFDLGGDSILSIQVISRAARAGIKLTAQQIFEAGTIANLSPQLELSIQAQASNEDVIGSAPLTPVQHWFFHHSGSNHYNQSVLLATPPDMDEAHLRDALEALLKHHDVLRCRFRHQAQGRIMTFLPAEEAPNLETDDFSELPEDKAREALEKAGTRLQTSLDIENGPMLRAGWYRFDTRSGRLLLVAHHLVVDTVSWRIILEDLQAAYQQRVEGRELDLPLKTSSFKDWSLRLSQYANSAAIAQEVSFWTHPNRSNVQPLPSEAVGEPGCGDHQVVLDEHHTSLLLTKVHKAYRTQINDFLLAALLSGFKTWTGSPHLLVDLEGHGREELFEDVDLSRTAGWFTTQIPLLLVHPDTTGPADVLRSVKESLRFLPKNGIGYGLLAHCCEDQEIAGLLAAQPNAEVSFNYLGQIDRAASGSTLFKLAGESVGPSQCEGDVQTHAIAVNCMVVGGCLKASWSYDVKRFTPATVEDLANNFLSALEAQIEHCIQPHAGGYTPSDFPLADLQQNALDRLVVAQMEIEDIYPLTPMQEGMLYQSLLQPDSQAYFEQLHCRVRGKFYPEHFRSAWRKVLERHAPMRTAFYWEGLEQPRQVVYANLQMDWEELDWRHYSANEQDGRFHDLLLADRRRGFDLSKAPLMRWKIVRVTETDHLFVWSHHHILLDGWSISQLLAELFKIYEWVATQMLTEYPEVVPFRNYISWLKQQDLAKAESYWRREMAGYLPFSLLQETALEFRLRDREPVEQSSTMDTALSAALTTQITEFVRRNQLTHATLIQGCWSLLLARYTDRDDVVFGVTVSGRPGELPGVESIIGLFINTLPVRVRITSDEDLLYWLQSLQEKNLTQDRFAYTPLVSIQKWSGLSSVIPLFDSLVVFINYPIDVSLKEERGMVQVDQVDNYEQTNYPLTFSAQMGERMSLRMEYDTQLFSEETVAAMLGHLGNLLAAMTKKSTCRLGELGVLSVTEKKHILEAWNRTERALGEAHLVSMFERIVDRFPHKTGVSMNDHSNTLTYTQLDQQANKMAHYLREKGVGPERVVALYLEREPQMLIAMWGVLKAGGAFLPIDRNYPTDRVNFMLGDAAVDLVLTSKPVDGLDFMGEIIVVPEVVVKVATSRATRLALPFNPIQAFCVFYTSGSTGVPKGAVTDHQTMTNYAEVMIEALGTTCDDRILQLASFSFDVFLEETLPTLLVGGELMIRRDGALISGSDLQQLIASQQITGLELPASSWSQWVAELERHHAAPPKSLRFVIVGCEKPSKKHFAYWSRFNIPIVMVFGLTETAITNTLNFPLRYTEKDHERSIFSIGKPVANNMTYVLDRQLQPQPLAVAGELCLGGLGLARNYVNQPKLTAERFIPDPFSTAPGGRMYRTGDRVHLLPDGNVDFIGREDRQISLRGFRIEIGEVENALRQHEALVEAAVMARDDVPGGLCLVAYLQLEKPAGDIGTQQAKTAEMKRFLGSRLPHYMVPAHCVYLDRIPTTTNGKIDYSALPAPDRDQVAQCEAPRTETERRIAEIWLEVLGLDVDRSIGVDENFFELGGHSLMATQVVSRIRETFSVDFSLPRFFEAPSIAGAAALVEEASHLDALPPITRGVHWDNVPVSFAQHRLWFIDKLEGGESANYNLPAALTIKGDLDLAVLERAFSEMLRRHESLRTSFTERDGHPYQVIDEYRHRTLEVLDQRLLAADQVDVVQRRLVAEDAMKPFDLKKSCMRTSVVRFPSHDLLLVNMHHIISDGWSIGIYVRELLTLYQAFAKGLPSPLPEPERQYADVAVHQRRWLTGERLQRQIDYWTDHLSGLPQQLNLPTDRPRPPKQTYSGRSIDFVIPTEVRDRMKELAFAQGATLFMSLLGAFGVLMSRYSNQRELAVGTPIANRNRREVENIIGLFVNTLVMRIDVSEKPNFHTILTRIRKTALEAYANQDVPFERLVETLQPTRNMSRHPLFQVMFSLENAPTDNLALPGLEICPLSSDLEAAKFDLMISMGETEQGLQGAIQYNTDLFDHDTIERLLQHYQTLLRGIASSPETPVERIALMAERERSLVLEEWQGSALPAYPPSQAHTRFERQARHQPEAAAIYIHGSDETKPWTYAHLEQAANQVAHSLLARGVTAGSLVGICMKRRTEMLAAILGVLKAGAAYVPLDPKYPRERIIYTLTDAQIGVLLCHGDVAEKLPLEEVDVIAIEALLADPKESAAPITIDDTGHLSHVIYTSGSTGKPKGVAISHHATGALLEWIPTAFKREYFDGVLASTSICFDLSVFEILGTLAYGGAVILAENALQLLEHTERERVTLVNTVPSAMAELLRMNGVPQGVKIINLAGEPLPAKLVRHIYEQTAVEGVYNLYGPSEDTTYSTFGLMPRGSDAKPSIGKAVAGSKALLLDADLQVQPIGIAGELCMAGEGLARGYHNRPGLTAERFIPNPHTSKPGERLYRTGDLARFLANGQIDFLGRMDHQVKLRGFRIELGEIEAALDRHPQVEEAVVMIQKHEEGGEDLLVAFLVAKDDQPLNRQSVIEHLRTALPEFMIPSVLVPLPLLPRTPNGKIDRNLLALHTPTKNAETIPDSGLTPVQQLLADLWEEFLPGKGFGPKDDFFEHGGHSLLATRLISRIAQVFDVNLSLVTLFESPSLEDLAHRIEQARGGTTALADIMPCPRDRFLPLSFAQQRMWFADRMEGGETTYHIPVIYEINDALDEEALARTFNEIVRRHEVLRTRFPLRDDVPVQEILPFEIRALEREDLSGTPKTQRMKHARAQAEAFVRLPFDLAQGPLFRYKLICLGDNQFLLAVTLHHIVTDDWSMKVLQSELGTLYQAFVDGNPSPLADLEVQYADYAAWQRDGFEQGRFDSQTTYWQQQLSNLPQAQLLPLDHPRPQRQSFSATSYTFQVEGALFEELKTLTRRNHATQFMSLLATFKVLLYRYTGQTDIAVGIPIAGRRHRQVEPMIGFFVNTLVMRNRLNDNPTFEEVLASVRRTALDAYANQDVPYDQLVKALPSQRTGALFQVMFNYQEFLGGETSDQFAAVDMGKETKDRQDFDLPFDLFMLTTWFGNRLEVSLEYNTGLFKAETIATMAERFKVLLESILQSPGTRIDRIKYKTEEEMVEDDQKNSQRKASRLGKLKSVKAESLPKE